MKLIPASSARWMILIDSSWSGLPHAPNIIAPRHIGLTLTPVAPSGRYSIALDHTGWHMAGRDPSRRGRPLPARSAAPRRTARRDYDPRRGMTGTDGTPALLVMDVQQGIVERFADHGALLE